MAISIEFNSISIYIYIQPYLEWKTSIHIYQTMQEYKELSRTSSELSANSMQTAQGVRSAHVVSEATVPLGVHEKFFVIPA